jgi:hypothetical protein
MEMRLTWATLKTNPPSLTRPATLLGIDVHVNDDDNGGTRDHKIAWHAVADNLYESPRRFGTLTLSPPRNAAEAAAAPMEDDPEPAPPTTRTPAGTHGLPVPAPAGLSAPASPAPASVPPAGSGTDAMLLAVVGVTALIVGGLGMRGLLANRQGRSGQAPITAPNADRAVAAPPLPPPFQPAAAEPPAKPVFAPEPSMALRPSSEGASPMNAAPAPVAGRRVPPAAAAWPWATSPGAAATGGGAAPGGGARLVGVSPAVVGIVVPLSEGAPDTNGEAAGEVEAAAFIDPANSGGGAAADETSNGDQVRIVVRPDGRFILRPLERADGVQTFLNDRLLRSEHPLQTGDEIQIGAARFRFEA